MFQWKVHHLQVHSSHEELQRAHDNFYDLINSLDVGGDPRCRNRTRQQQPTSPAFVRPSSCTRSRFAGLA